MAEQISTETAASWQSAFEEISNALPAQGLPGHMPYAPAKVLAIELELPERIEPTSSPVTPEEIQAFFDDIFR